jgi:murein DD-endopeptidase / murein LD-carboxypeptidase
VHWSVGREWRIVFYMLDPRLDLSRSPIKIPERFHKVLYDEKRYPGAPGVRGVTEGANCQQYAYEFVRAFGFTIPDLRSSDLWADTAHTHVAKRPKPFDLLLVHDAPISWGAHVGVYLGKGLILHLSKKLGVPAIEPVQSMMCRVEYRHLIGFKRIGGTKRFTGVTGKDELPLTRIRSRQPSHSSVRPG